MAAEAKMWLQETIYGCSCQDVAAGAMRWLLEPRCGCLSQDVDALAKMLFKVHVGHLEQCFDIIALKGRAQNQLIGQGPLNSSVG